MAIQSKLLTEDLVDYTLGLGHESIPPEVLDKTKQLFLDYLGVAFGGRRFAEASPSIMGAVDDLSNGQRGPCTVVGDVERFPPHYAALLNGAFAHAMDFDDTHRDAVMHPGAPVFSTLMALAEESGVSGRDLLTAAVAGYDVANKLGKAVKGGIHKRGLHPTATTGIFAATVAAARLLGLSRDEAINAMGINVSQAAGSQQFVEFGGWNKPFHVGMAAHNAIFALTLARRGFLGASSPLEGRFGYFFSYSANGWDPGEIAGLGTEFEVMYTGIKPYPCCRYNHSVIGAVKQLVQEQGLSSDDIASMDIYMNPVGHSIVGEPVDLKRRPTTPVLGQFSVYFAAAVGAVYGDLNWQTYEKLQDTTLQDLMSVTTCWPTEEMPPMACRLDLATKNGQKLSAEVAHPKGEPENPLSWEESIAKFTSLSQETLGQEGSQRVVTAVRDLEHVGDISSFAQVLRP